jgi:hypothetical protein
MAKRIEEAEVKKECPSCGLGVALDSTICEFCGWDFEEEDEWILQIEKLERDLMLEKQKFAPGTMNAKIESTIHTPAFERAATFKVQDEGPTPQVPALAPPAVKSQEPRFAPSPVRQPLRSEPEEVPQPSEKIRRVRSVKASPEEAPVASPQPAGGKVRRVRSVKQAKPSDELDEFDLDIIKEPESKTRTIKKGGK